MKEYTAPWECMYAKEDNASKFISNVLYGQLIRRFFTKYENMKI